MNIGIFTDTYYPQVSGVATSIKTLKNQLERQGHNVYIFTTTDPNVEKNVYERNLFRFASIPFISFTDRRIAVRGLFQAYQVAKELSLDIVHTQTEFSMGMIGKFVAKMLKIPCLHTYHTMYEDYLHYVANGKLLRPYHVKQMTKSFCHNLNGIVAPSERVLATLTRYGVKEPIAVIPTGIDIAKFQQRSTEDVRAKLGIAPQTPVMLTLSRLAFEKDIDHLITLFPQVLADLPQTKFVICGDGPAKEKLMEQVKQMKLEANVIFTGEINNDDVARYYQMADLFVSASVSESQGLTYIEAMAAGLPVVATHSPYTDQLLDNPNLGAVCGSQSEFVANIEYYLRRPVIDESFRKNKLFSISAENFGHKIVAFYQQCQADFARKQAVHDSDELS